MGDRASKKISLHERTVQDAEKHALTYARSAKPTTKRSRNGRVVNLKVDRRVWKTAMELANGDGSRIEIISETEVRVR